MGTLHLMLEGLCSIDFQEVRRWGKLVHDLKELEYDLPSLPCMGKQERGWAASTSRRSASEVFSRG